ncbi:MAG TPA: zinc ribbon domain-containing protein [Candidatus Methylomirabilis sp.]|nr:zinc ribbon domain-containing protein [Candidatus Methylomirabilis sp.]
MNESPTNPYPAPRETAINRPMLEAWREGVLALQRCADCGAIFFIARSLCPRCWSAALAWLRSDGRGRIVSWSQIHRGLPAAFTAEAPITLAEIEVTEGATLLARVVCDRLQSVTTGSAVELMRLPDALRYPLPTFVMTTERSR